jgi:hypothetical protein
MLFLKRALFWDMMPCTLIEVYRRFDGMFFFSLQWSKSKPSKEPTSSKHSVLLASCWLLALLTLRTVKTERYVPPKRR